MEAELKDIIFKSNPWNEAEIENWRDTLNAGESGEFVLKADYDIIASYNRQCIRAEYCVQTNLLPQPFIGNPEAPIWIITQNPGFCEIDFYDMLGGEKKEISDCLKKEIKQTESKETLKKRQKLLLGQLRFYVTDDVSSLEKSSSEESPSFYILEECFHTLKKHKGNKSLGGYEWWERHLLGTKESNSKLFCKRKKEMLSKFFVLELFPYHSKQFDEKISIKTVHYTFWKELVSYALRKGKLLICRKKKIIEEIQKLSDFERNKDNILRFVSSRAFLSNGNLIPLRDYAGEKKEDLKKYAAELVYAVLNK